MDWHQSEYTPGTGSGIHSIATTCLPQMGEDIPRGSPTWSKEGKTGYFVGHQQISISTWTCISAPTIEKNKNLSIKLKILAKVVKERILINLISYVTMQK